MIGFLSGTPKVIGTETLVMTGGVGYKVAVGSSLLAKLITLEHVELFIYTHVREDALQLYGFADYRSQELFTLLLSVSGVGPRIALILADRPAEQIISAVQNAEVGFFTAVPRVGKKLAQKIIIELRSKLGEMKALNLGADSEAYQTLTETLEGLGFATYAIDTVLRELDLNKLSIEEALKIAIKRLGS